MILCLNIPRDDLNVSHTATDQLPAVAQQPGVAQQPAAQPQELSTTSSSPSFGSLTDRLEPFPDLVEQSYHLSDFRYRVFIGHIVDVCFPAVFRRISKGLNFATHSPSELVLNSAVLPFGFRLN